MTFNKIFFGILLVITATYNARAQSNISEIQNLFRDLEAKAAEGITNTDEADQVLERFKKGNRDSVAGAMPLILYEASNPHVSIRRIAALTLFEVSTRPDGQELLSAETSTFTALLIDPDTPIRRVTCLAIVNLHLNASSSLLPVLREFLTRDDAVSTVGPAVAGVLMQAAPNSADSTKAVVQFMQRQDNTSKSRHDTLLSIGIARPDNPEIAKEVAVYADDPDEQLSVYAIETLQSMGKNSIAATQQSLARIAADTNRPPSVRAAAAKALSTVP